MSETNGYLVKGEMYPTLTIRCEQAMLEYILELEVYKQVAEKQIAELEAQVAGLKLRATAVVEDNGISARLLWLLKKELEVGDE